MLRSPLHQLREPPLGDVAQTNEERANELFPRLPNAEAREQLVRLYFPLVEYLVRRFRRRSEPLDDLTQVGALGLIKAIDRFDHTRGIKFSTYAVPTIVGELKRHFRDTGWAMRVPRRLQERCLLVRQVVSEMYQELGRSPSITDIADRAGLTVEEALEAMESGNAHSLQSLDAPYDDADSSPLERVVGVDDPTLEMLEGWTNVAPLLRELPERERRLLHLRFVCGMTQSEIATEMDVSQMHVSRLLSRTLSYLRDAIGVDAGDR